MSALSVVLASPAHAASGTWERAWGKDVVAGGSTGFETCTLAAICQTGDSTGGLGGEMHSPEGVATDAAGNVYLADPGNNRIQKFDSSGNFLRTWGKDVDSAAVGTDFEICIVAANCQTGDSTGGLGGEMNGPSGVAIDAAGNVYVADTFNQRIQKFDASGNFVRAWGKDVDSVAAGTGFEICTVAASCQAGATGGLGGEMNIPTVVAADAAGNVYLADTANIRIQKFDSSGNFLRTWGKDVDSVATGTDFEICTVDANCQAGATGGLGGEMDTPRAVATDAANNVYLADRLNNRIQKFDSSGNFLRTWGRDVDSGTAATDFEICTVSASCKTGDIGGLGGEMNLPQGVGTDATGAVYVADSSNDRIQKFDSSGNFLAAWGKDVITGGGAGFEICTVAASCQGDSPGGLGGEMNLPTGVATDAAGNLYLGDRFNHRVQRFSDFLPNPPGGGGSALPSNAFSIAGLTGRTLKLIVSAVGNVTVTDAGTAKRLLKPSSASGGPGTIKVFLRLTRLAKQKLRQKGKVRVNARITFTPTGGLANSQTAKLKIRQR